MLRMKWEGYRRDDARRARPAEYKTGPLPRDAALPLHARRPRRSSTAARERWDPDLKREFEEYFDEAVAKGWQIVPKHAAAHPLRGRRQPAAARARLRPHDREPPAEARPAGHRRLAHEQHRALQRLRASRPPAGTRRTTSPGARRSRPSPRDDARGRAARRVEDRLGVPLPVPEDRCSSAPCERGIREFRDRGGQDAAARPGLRRVHLRRPLHRGRTPRSSSTEMLSLTTNLGGVSWEELKEKGFARYTGVGMQPSQIGHATDIEPDETHHGQHLAGAEEAALADAHAAHAVLHRPRLLPRARRGAARPQGQPADRRRLPAADDRRPHALVDPRLVARPEAPAAACSAASRWSSSAPRTRQARGIADGDRVRVYNDIGSFEVAGEGHADAAPRAGDRLPRLGALSSSRAATPTRR